MKQIGEKYNRKRALHDPAVQEKRDAALQGKLEAHHIVSKSKNTPVNLLSFTTSQPTDPAKKVSQSRSNFVIRLTVFLELHPQTSRSPAGPTAAARIRW